MSFFWTGVISTGANLYTSRKQRKAQKQAREDAAYRELIEGAAPNIANVDEVILEEIGKELAGQGGLQEALDEIRYREGEQAQQEEQQEEQGTPIDQEILQLLEQNPELFDETMMSRGGPVGQPNNVYYFGVPQIMDMMQDPDPRVQNVGRGLAGQFNPESSMVPATPAQIEQMAMGGQVPRLR
tara:strand:+ start:75 stop:626 length:552 start_codon:yes stop_codon:yes gene_type:complete